MIENATVITFWHCAPDQRLTRTNPCEHCGSIECEPAMWADVDLSGGNAPLGLAEIAERLDVARATVDSWRTRDLLPAANWTVGGRPAWSWDVIETWAQHTGRLQNTTTARIAIAEDGDLNVYEIAATVDKFGQVITGSLALDPGHDPYARHTYIETVAEVPAGAELLTGHGWDGGPAAYLLAPAIAAPRA